MLYKSADGGESWFLVKEGSPFSEFAALNFLNDSVGYLAENFYSPDSSIVYFTHDGGTTWITTDFDSVNLDISCIDCIDEYTCFLNAQVKIFKTTNGGISLALNQFQQVNYSISPNPASSIITLSISNPENYQHAIKSITTTNYLGERINLTFNSGFQADVSELPPGIYLTQIITETGKGVQEWVKM